MPSGDVCGANKVSTLAAMLCVMNRMYCVCIELAVRKPSCNYIIHMSVLIVPHT